MSAKAISGIAVLALVISCSRMGPPSLEEVKRAASDENAQLINRWVSTGDLATHLRLVHVLSETRNSTTRLTLQLLARSGDPLVRRAIAVNCEKLPSVDALVLLDILRNDSDGGVREEADEIRKRMVGNIPSSTGDSSRR